MQVPPHIAEGGPGRKGDSPRSTGGPAAGLEGSAEASHRVILTLQGEGLLLQQPAAVVIVRGENAADLLAHHRIEAQPPADRGELPVGTTLHGMHRLMQEGLRADAQIEGDRRHPERATGGLVLAVGPRHGGRSPAQPEPIPLQIAGQGAQLGGQPRRQLGVSGPLGSPGGRPRSRTRTRRGGRLGPQAAAPGQEWSRDQQGSRSSWSRRSGP